MRRRPPRRQYASCGRPPRHSSTRSRRAWGEELRATGTRRSWSSGRLCAGRSIPRVGSVR
jgi:hypothetical protein